jgi:hypothetical protein
MTQTISFSADHIRFYQGQEQIFPHIQAEEFPLEDASQGVVIVLPSRLDCDLNWQAAIARAEECIERGKWILWHFDFGLEEPSFDINDETQFLSFTVAIDLFTKTLWPRFQEKTFGVSLYRGDLERTQRSIKIEDSHFFEWCDEKLQNAENPLSDLMFSLEVFAEYLHRLISFFPDTVIPFACVDVSAWNFPGLLSVLLSKQRFEHVYLAIRGLKNYLSPIQWDASGALSCAWVKEPENAVCIPEDLNCSLEVCTRLDALFGQLETQNIPFRLIAEGRLTEEWDGIDRLYVLKDAVSVQGNRKLLGFAAAGGEVVEC